jgi:hypothetical protein
MKNNLENSENLFIFTQYKLIKTFSLFMFCYIYQSLKLNNAFFWKKESVYNWTIKQKKEN